MLCLKLNNSKFILFFWYVSDISIKAATDTAFNPDYVKVSAPVPPLLQRPDRIRFLVEFYDVNNNIADSIIFSEPFTFDGPNINISGTDNILSGSMYIGNSIGGGVEMAGVNSAFIRSMGYRGFKSGSGFGNNAGTGEYSGFMFYSGSVLPDSGDDYQGVGLELVGKEKFDSLMGKEFRLTDKLGKTTTVTMSPSGVMAGAHLRGLYSVVDLLEKASLQDGYYRFTLQTQHYDEIDTPITKYLTLGGGFQLPVEATLSSTSRPTPAPTTKTLAAGTVPAAVIIIGIAFSKVENDSITALYPAKFA